jgi:hypothetical protein
MIIDIYKFIINNYSSSMKKPTKFNEIKKTSDINNAIIHASNDDNDDNNDNDNDIYSLDYIRSNPIKNKYYHLYLNKDAKVDKVDYIFTDEYYNNFCENIKKVFIKTKKHYTKLLIKNLLNKNLITDKLEPFDLSTDGYIKKVYVTNNDKIIIFGDYHGSFHTFFRNLLRLHIMGVLNLNTYKINDNYKIIFLGDIIDRGQYSLEILDILFKFIINNKSNKLLINKGNHEDILQNTVDGFLKEIKSKVNNKKISKLLHQNINNIFNYLSTAIILINKDNNKKYWLCHGFIPQDYDFLEKIKEFIKNDDNILLINNYHAFQIKWNDTSIENESNNNAKRTMEPNTIFSVGLNITKEYLKIFDFIIRGHEDSISNAWLLSNNPSNKYFILSSDYLKDKTEQFELHKSNNKLINKNNEMIDIYNINDNSFINGPIQTIYSNNLQNNNLQSSMQSNNNNLINVLTISTNTDYLRNLTSDSFVVLRFNEKKLPKVMKSDIDIDKWLNKLDNYTIFKDDNYNQSKISKVYNFLKNIFYK